MPDSRPPIDLLCRVVDNYGDIGVVFRLAKALGAAAPGRRLRIVVDDLAAFAALEPAVDPALPVQEVRGWTLVQWDHDWEGFRAEPPRAVVEAFACGKPTGFEELLFDPADPSPRRVANLEYLTAEPYAEDFHLLRAATRSALVEKRFFMPGFTAKTGGLVIDPQFARARARAAAPESRPGFRRAALERALAAGAALMPAGGGEGGPPALPPAPVPVPAPPAAAGALPPPPAALPQEAAALLDRPWLALFTYEHDYALLLASLAARPPAERPLLLAAAGRSQACVRGAWESAGRPCPLLALPFLPQETWDELLLAADAALVRGEESLSRAALGGRPFLWHIYPQEGRHHLVKLRAFHELLRPRLSPAAFAAYESASLALNDRDPEADRPAQAAADAAPAQPDPAAAAPLPAAAPAAEAAAPAPPAAARLESLAPLLDQPELGPAFRSLGEELFALGDLSSRLLAFLDGIG